MKLGGGDKVGGKQSWRKVKIGKIESMETWRKKTGKYQENWNCGKYGMRK